MHPTFVFLEVTHWVGRASMLTCPLCKVAGIDIPLAWIYYVQKITEQFDMEPWFPVCIPYNVITIADSGTIVDNFMPDIIVWDPLVQFPTLSDSLNKCLAEKCENVMERREWQNGRNPVSMPRIIHEINGVVLLVSRMYVCSSGHRYLSHNERILVALPCPAHLPFVLSHRSGLTIQCLSLVILLIGEAKKISSVEDAFTAIFCN